MDRLHKFCGLCDWTYQCWLTRKHLFDANLAPSLLDHPNHKDFFLRLSHITQEYWLHQLIKLHDPAVQSGQINLTIEYIINYGGWDTATTTELGRLKDKMSDLAQKLKSARNKILSHNDLSVILTNEELGGFDSDMDASYFLDLQEFVNLIHDKSIGAPFPFDDLVINDVRQFLASFSAGCRERR